MFHGIILDTEFTTRSCPESLNILPKERAWDENPPQHISEIQQNIRTDIPYHAHFYNDEKLVVIFKDKVF